MNVLGVDLSLTATGIAYPDGSTALLRPKKPHDSGMARLAWIRDGVWYSTPLPMSMREVDLVVLEGYNMGASRATSHGHALGELGGVVRLHLFEQGMPYVDVAPAALKKFATGKGNAPKDAVLAAAVRAGFAGDDNNEADAWWLRAMALYAFGVFDVPPTGYRDTAVFKVEWPIFGAGSVAS